MRMAGSPAYAPEPSNPDSPSLALRNPTLHRQPISARAAVAQDNMTSANRRSSRFNDLDLSNWQQYEDLLTDSLWILDSRDSSGAHQADYHGNFIPQIPNQLLRRFTKAGEIVLDPFIGSGTTAIEANRLNRRYVGVELAPAVANLARQRIIDDSLSLLDSPGRERYLPLPRADDLNVITGNSAADSNDEEFIPISSEISKRLSAYGASSVQFLIMHPPYHNIIKFSDDAANLSNCRDVDHFLEQFMVAYRNMAGFLEPGRHLAVVIGDIYQSSEWVPLQGLLTSALLSSGDLRLKGIIVKNIANNRAKRNREHLWRYRALANGFYIFKHEYIVLFQKLGRRR